MKPTIALALLVSNLFFCVGCQPRTESARRTVAVFEPSTIDLGEVEPGTRLSAELKLKNTTTSTLVIAGAASSCSCGKPTFTSASIAPLGMTITHVDLNAPSTAGPIRYKITAWVSDGNGRHEAEANLRAIVAPFYLCVPTRIQTPSLLSHDSYETVVRLSHLKKMPMIVESLTPSAPWITATLTDSRDEQELAIRVKITAPETRLLLEQAILKVTMLQPERRMIDIPIDVPILPSVTSDPGQIRLGVIESGVAVRKAIVLRASNPLNPVGAVKSITPPEGVEVKLMAQKLVSGLGQQIELDITPTFKSPAIVGTLLLTIDGKSEDVSIPFSAFHKRALAASRMSPPTSP